MVPVFDINNQTQKALIHTALEQAGIDFFIKDCGNLDAYQSKPFIHHSQVRVLEQDVDLAKSIIEQVVGEDA
jgi:hypothetical protein